MSRADTWEERDYLNRPTEFDHECARRIVARVGSGEMLPEICRNDPDLPLPGVFLGWCDEDEDLMNRYQKARRYGAEIMVDMAVIESRDKDPSVAGVRSRAAMWHAERTHPDRYGPRAVVGVRSADDDQHGGVDYRAQVRARLESMAGRATAADEARAELAGTADT